jgi:hypothetical protein
MTPFSIDVGYQLREYLSVVLDFAQYMGNVRSRDAFVHPLPFQTEPLGILLKVGLVLTAIPIFFYKVIRIGRCRFDFSESGLIRHSRSRTLEFPWTDVLYVYSLSKVYFIMKKAGALPIPYRCLSSSQRDQLERFFTTLNATRSHPPVNPPAQDPRRPIS